MGLTRYRRGDRLVRKWDRSILNPVFSAFSIGQCVGWKQNQIYRTSQSPLPYTRWDDYHKIPFSFLFPQIYFDFEIQSRIFFLVAVYSWSIQSTDLAKFVPERPSARFEVSDCSTFSPYPDFACLGENCARHLSLGELLFGSYNCLTK